MTSVDGQEPLIGFINRACLVCVFKKTIPRKAKILGGYLLLCSVINPNYKPSVDSFLRAAPGNSDEYSRNMNTRFELFERIDFGVQMTVTTDSVCQHLHSAVI